MKPKIIDLLPNDYELYKEALEEQRRVDNIQNAQLDIAETGKNGNFNWEGSTKGFTYWADINKRYKQYLFKIDNYSII